MMQSQDVKAVPFQFEEECVAAANIHFRECEVCAREQSTSKYDLRFSDLAAAAKSTNTADVPQNMQMSFLC